MMSMKVICLNNIAHPEFSKATEGLKTGYVFICSPNESYLQVHTSSLIYIRDLIFRNPFREIAAVFNSRARKQIFDSLKRRNQSTRGNEPVAALVFEFDSGRRILRLREIGRDQSKPNSSASTRYLISRVLPELGRRMGASVIQAETFEAYGNILLGFGWEQSWKGRSIFIRLACWLNRYRAYSLKLERT